ncbi:MAG: hypothetical protein ABW167_09625 [Baekduia sp.]
MTPQLPAAYNATVVNGDDFVEALNDSKARTLAADGVAYLKWLQAEGRDHSVPTRPRLAEGYRERWFPA